ncbi:MAG: hypothetical protein M3Z23_06505 [Acidobacteriota bacterium]|nr:hypothetical protein [Acidobacteriota bacterium]
MPAIDDWHAERRLTRLKKFRITELRDGSRIETEHYLSHEAAASQLVLRHAHEPVCRIKFIAAAGTGLPRIHQERLGHRHEVPGAKPRHRHRHAPRLRIHAGAGCLAHQQLTRRISLHIHFHILSIHVVHNVHIVLPGAAWNCRTV